MSKVIRAIEWFLKREESYIGQEEIQNFNLDHFKKIFNHKCKEDPIIYGFDYRIEPWHIPEVQPYVQHEINLEKYDYLFSTYTDCKNEDLEA